MTNEAKLLIKWLNEVTGIPAYQDPVSSEAKLPYISLNVSIGDFATATLQQLTIWTRSDSSYAEAYNYADKIEKALGNVGVLADNDDCILWIKKGSPFAQNKLDDTTTIRAVLMNLEISAY